MQNSIFTKLPEGFGGDFGKKPLGCEHNLHEREMFSDAGLVRLLETYPRDEFNIYTMNDDPRTGKRVFRRGHAGDASGEEILDAIKSGRLWLNLRATNDHLDEYDELCSEMFGSLEDEVPGLKTLRRDCGVLISSPKARVFYHLDIPLVTLWQIRGEKTFYVFPNGSPFVDDHELESVVLREEEEEITYDERFEASAKRYELKPGVMVSWPQNAPHRIDNGDSLNVSLSCEFQTMESVVRANALYTNGVMRRKLGMSPDIAKIGSAGLYTRASIARVMKAFNSRKVFEKEVPVTFVVDPSSETGFREQAAV
ncbi:MAG: hypothetical protein ABJG15_17515 [Hyphomonadaceae bacterium]